MTTQHEHDQSVDQRIEELHQEVRRTKRRLKAVAGGLLAAMLALTVAPAAANHLTVRSSDIVDGTISPQDLRNDSVGPRKIADGGVRSYNLGKQAVGPRKIADRAVSNKKLARYVPGMAVAGADIGTAGTLYNWFNRFGGQPTVNKIDTGEYVVAFPGLEGRLDEDAIVSAMLYSASGSIVQGSSTNSSVLIRTYNSSGTVADRAFDLAIIAPNDAGALSGSPSTHTERD